VGKGMTPEKGRNLKKWAESKLWDNFGPSAKRGVVELDLGKPKDVGANPTPSTKTLI